MQYVVNALLDVYDPVIQGMFSQGLPTFTDFSATLIFEESRRNMRRERTREETLALRRRRNSTKSRGASRGF